MYTPKTKQTKNKKNYVLILKLQYYIILFLLIFVRRKTH